MITQPEDYFAQGCGRCSRFATPACSSQTWAAGLQALRQVCLGVGLVETAKWGHPCYTHQGRNIAILGALRGDFRLTFFNASLLKDQHQLLQSKGANSAHPDTLSFTDASQVKAVAASLRAYLQEAMALAHQSRQSASRFAIARRIEASPGRRRRTLNRFFQAHPRAAKKLRDLSERCKENRNPACANLGLSRAHLGGQGRVGALVKMPSVSFNIRMTIASLRLKILLV